MYLTRMTKLLSNSKRLWITVGVTAVNVITLVVSMVYDKDPISVATALTIIDAPIFAYLGVESWKPSNKKQDEVQV